MQWSTLSLLIIVVFTYVVFGGIIFHMLEDTESQYPTLIETRFASKFLEKYTDVDAHDLEELLTETFQAIKRGTVHSDESSQKNKWDIVNSIFFAGTLISTIGYGNLAPHTTEGRIFCILYGIIGIPQFLLVMAGVGSRINAATLRLVQRSTRIHKYTNGVKITKAFILLLSGSMVFLLIPAIVFSTVENWTYGESVYYSFVTLSTIGFGDYISGMNPSIDYPMWYRLGRQVWLCLGLAWLSTMVGAKQDAIKSFLRTNYKSTAAVQQKAPWGAKTRGNSTRMKYYDKTQHLSDDETMTQISNNGGDASSKIQNDYVIIDSSTTKRCSKQGEDDERPRAIFYL